MSTTRRDFLRLAGFAAAGCAGCAGMGGGAERAWSAIDLKFLESNAIGRGGRGWAAWQGRRRVAAWRPDERSESFSITKSIATLAACRAATEGWLNPAEKVSETLTEWRTDPQKNRITVRMLLQQVSGLDAGVIPLYRNHPREKGRAAVGLRCIDAPGTVFRYGPGHWEVLAEVARRKLARKGETLSAFMRRSVMDPIGLYAGNWRSDAQQNPYLSTGTQLSINELGRLGFALGRLLSGEDVHGISAEQFAAMARPSTVNPMFGGGIWWNSRVSKPGAVAIEVEGAINHPMSASFWSRACLSRSQPAGFVALIGSSGKRLYIWPDGRIFARLGSTSSWSDVPFLSRLGG